MKMYELTFSDPDLGFVRRFERNKRAAAATVAEAKAQHPLRELLTEKQIEIPTDKTSFVDW